MLALHSHKALIRVTRRHCAC